MKSQRFAIGKVVFPLLMLCGIFCLSQKIFASTISGIVYDNRRVALIDVDVELQDDFYRQIARTKTTASGRYEFGGLSDGRYTVKVLPFRYDLLDQSMEVEVATVVAVPGGTSNTFITQDFYLSPRKGSLAEAETGVIFAQEVPKEAENAYKSAIKNLSKKRNEEAIVGLRNAVEIFPTYYLALDALGKQLFQQEKYGEAIQILLRATEVNPKSPTTFYYLGYSLNKLNYNKAALIPLQKALTLAPASVQVLYILGLAEEAEGKYAEAEKHLVQAKKYSKVVNPDIYWQLGQIYGNKLNRYNDAADELDQYLKIGKYSDDFVAKLKKVINDLREKAKKPS